MTRRASDNDQTGNELLVGGVSALAIGAIGAVVSGAVCPLCIVATPALLGAGLVKKWQAHRERQQHEEREALGANEEGRGAT